VAVDFIGGVNQRKQPKLCKSCDKCYHISHWQMSHKSLTNVIMQVTDKCYHISHWQMSHKSLTNVIT
jgi:hypothetical protein